MDELLLGSEFKICRGFVPKGGLKSTLASYGDRTFQLIYCVDYYTINTTVTTVEESSLGESEALFEKLQLKPTAHQSRLMRFRHILEELSYLSHLTIISADIKIWDDSEKESIYAFIGTKMQDARIQPCYY